MEWIEMSERLPEIDEWCFFWYGGIKPMIGNHKGNGKFLCSEDNDIWSVGEDGITHWMSCPPPPIV